MQNNIFPIRLTNLHCIASTIELDGVRVAYLNLLDIC